MRHLIFVSSLLAIAGTSLSPVAALGAAALKLIEPIPFPDEFDLTN